MKKILFYIIAILSAFIFINNVYAVTLPKPTGQYHLSLNGPNINNTGTITESTNAWGYPNWAMFFDRDSSNGFINWYKFNYSSIPNSCDGDATIKGTFMTWTAYSPGVFNNTPYVNWVNHDYEVTPCSIQISQNGNVVDFICIVDNLGNKGSFDIGFNDPGYVNVNGTETGNWSSYVGMSKNIDISCEINTNDIVNSQNNNTNTIINNQDKNANNIIDNQNKNQAETNQKLDDLNDNLTNSDAPDNMDGLSNSAGWLPPGPIDSILNLPLSMLTNISDNLNKSCQTVNLPLPFVNKDLPLPCLSSIYSQIDGLSPWITTISVIASAFILFSYLLKLYKWVDDTLTFRENNEIDNWGGL